MLSDYVIVVAWLQLFILDIVASPALAETVTLSLPLQCQMHESCFIQNYVDVDPSTGALDHRCNQATYDGHKGTDFRVISTSDAKKGVSVVAAAPGRVKAIRDSMQDRLVGKDANAVEGRECGNGVVIDHGQGWETQYCHLRRGSVRVRRGQHVERGEPIGLVGFSGNAQFAHLHFAVRQKRRVIDPFTGKVPGGRCDGNTIGALWQSDIHETLKYRHGELIEIGFADRPVTPGDLEIRERERMRPSNISKAIVFYVRFINLEKGDQLRLILDGPSGMLMKKTTYPLERHKAHYVAYVGRKLRAKRWTKGRYHGRVELLRSGSAVLDRHVALDVQ